jgi:hypothetical protein
MPVSCVSTLVVAQERPENQEDFNAGMKSVDGLGLAALIADFDWERFDRYIDVGGAFGSVLNALLVHNPKAHGEGLLLR